MNFIDQHEDTIITDGGEYTVVATLCEHTTDATIGLCVGRAADGHCDLIATDNACNRIVGNLDDDEYNHDQFTALDEAGVVIDLDAIRAIDADLADYIADCMAAADA